LDENKSEIERFLFNSIYQLERRNCLCRFTVLFERMNLPVSRRNFLGYAAGAVGVGVAAAGLSGLTSAPAAATTNALPSSTPTNPMTAQANTKTMELETEPNVMPPDIMPVLVLSGSDYEMGYQYGMQAGALIAGRVKRVWRGRLLSLSRDAVTLWMKRSQYYILQYVPEAIDFMAGMARGSTDAGYNVTYEDVLLINLYWLSKTDAAAPPDDTLDSLPPWHYCSSWSAWGSTTKDGRLVCGSSADDWFESQLTIVAFPDGGRNSWISTCLAGELADQPAMNSKGVYIALGGGLPEKFELRRIGVCETFAVYKMLNDCKTATEAKDFILNFPQAGGEYWQVDVNNHWVVEGWGATKRSRTVGFAGERDFLYRTNNFLLPESGEAYAPANNPVYLAPNLGWLSRNTISSINRNKQIWTMFTRYHGQVDLEFAKMMWRQSGNPPPFPIDSTAFYATKGRGWDNKIGNSGNLRCGIGIPDALGTGKIYLCTGPAAAVAWPSSPGLYLQPIEPTNEFFELTLAPSISAIDSAASSTANTCYHSARWALQVLSNTDPRYPSLNQLAAQAMTEFWEGKNWEGAATMASGNDALFFYSKALTAFTRSQIHSKQICNAIKAPPDDPTDLGLQPYAETAW
jgi:hypothetical protein